MLNLHEQCRHVLVNEAYILSCDIIFTENVILSVLQDSTLSLFLAMLVNYGEP